MSARKHPKRARLARDTLLPRPARSHIKGFSIPWQMLRRDAHHFLGKMNDAREDHDPIEGGHWDTYALATQVFAAMAAEAQLNTYGLVRFGEELFEQHFRWDGPETRFRRMALHGWAPGPHDVEALVPTLRSLMAKRDPIVHMQANEEVFDHSGQVIRPAPRPPDHAAGAEAAVREMETFLIGFGKLVGQYDIENWTYIAPLDRPPSR